MSRINDIMQRYSLFRFYVHINKKGVEPRFSVIMFNKRLEKCGSCISAETLYLSIGYGWHLIKSMMLLGVSGWGLYKITPEERTHMRRCM
jgi:hypothetical protein